MVWSLSLAVGHALSARQMASPKLAGFPCPNGLVVAQILKERSRQHVEENAAVCFGLSRSISSKGSDLKPLRVCLAEAWLHL